ncbi:hypothetical protein RB195_011625 [Necator americanus]|uniref:Endonuclease/exonuclease/phosphatase domain-containing protein n=1 Tax=Necator americanus TaxID=51031 RepID=A0ABR1D3A1_NECAM
MTICAYNVRTLGPKAAIEDLMMHANKIKYDVIRPTETRRCHPLNPFEQLTTSADEKMWFNPSFDYLRRLSSNIKLRRRSRGFLYGS